MQWRDHFKIGVPEIDEQHKQLFQIANQLEAAHNTNSMYQEMGRSLKLLVDHSMQHFKTEEAYMQEIGFPKLENHAAKHREFMKQIMEILVKLKSDRHVSPSQLIEMTSHWIFNHTLNDDIRIKHFLEALEKEKESKKQQESEAFRASTVSQLEQVTNLVRKETIPVKNYEAKKRSLLEGLTRFDGNVPMDEVLARIATIEMLLERQLVTEEEEKTYRVKIFDNVDLDKELALKEKPKKQRSYLKSLYLKDLITEERYQHYSNQIDGKVCGDGKPAGSDTVCLL